MKTVAHQPVPSISTATLKTESRCAPAVPCPDGTITSTMGDYPGMQKIIAEYVEGLPDDVRKMRELLENGDLRPLRRVVHQLRGTGGGYGFDAISELAASAEAAIDAADNHVSIALKIRSLIDVIRRIEGFDKRKTITPNKGDML